LLAMVAADCPTGKSICADVNRFKLIWVVQSYAQKYFA
jgi:hypothetical protein